MAILLTTGQRIVDLARRSQISLPTACQAIGVKYGTLHAQISNGRPIPFETIDELSRFYNVPISYFSPNSAMLGIQGAGGEDASAASDAQMNLSSIAEKVMQAGYMPGADAVLDYLCIPGLPGHLFR